MAVRVRLRLRSKSGVTVDTSALVNTGFETEKPQLLIPIRLARELGLWPPPPEVELVELGTAGGPIRNYLIRDSLEVQVVTKDRIVGPVTCDAILSHIESEVLINDKLGEELGIMIIGMGSGKWKFIDDPTDTVRYSEKPQYW